MSDQTGCPETEYCESRENGAVCLPRVGVNQACEASVECEASLECREERCQGTLALDVRCAPNLCDEGLVCDTRTSPWRCAPVDEFGGPNEPCRSSGSPCDDELSCLTYDGDDFCIATECGAPGDPCNSDDATCESADFPPPCDVYGCPPGQYCDVTGDQLACADLGAPGGPCVDGQCTRDTARGEECTQSGQCADGLGCNLLAQPPVCDDIWVEGVDCSEADRCGIGLVCHTSIIETPICSPASSVGGDCRRDRDCDDGLFCDAGTCAERRDIGATCERDGECVHEVEVCEHDDCFSDSVVCNDASNSCELAGERGARCQETLDCRLGYLCATSLAEPECRNRLEPGEACAEDRECGPFSTCESGQCSGRSCE